METTEEKEEKPLKTYGEFYGGLLYRIIHTEYKKPCFMQKLALLCLLKHINNKCNKADTLSILIKYVELVMRYDSIDHVNSSFKLKENLRSDIVHKPPIEYIDVYR